MSFEGQFGETNVTIVEVEAPGGHDSYGDPTPVTKTTVEALFWFEEKRGEQTAVESPKRWDAVLIGVLDETVTEQTIVKLNDGTRWKVIDYDRLQGFDLEGDGSGGEERLELRVQRQRAS